MHHDVEDIPGYVLIGETETDVDHAQRVAPECLHLCIRLLFTECVVGEDDESSVQNQNPQYLPSYSLTGLGLTLHQINRSEKENKNNFFHTVTANDIPKRHTYNGQG